MSKAKAKKAAANVVDLQAFRETRSSSASQEASPQPPRWSHMDGALWALTQNDDLQEVADLLNEWEMNFLEDMAQQEWPATPRQIRALNRIILMINGMLVEMKKREINGPNPAA
jgi:hypothetical protein